MGSSAGISASKPISRRARTGFGPRVILRVVRSASRKAGSRSMRRARPSSRRRPSPVINTRSSHVPFTNQRSQAATGSASGASRMAIIGQGMASAPRSSSIRTSWPSSRVSGTTIRRPLSSSVMPDLSLRATRQPVAFHWHPIVLADGPRLNHRCQDSAKIARPCQACPPSPWHLAAAHVLW